MSTERIAEIRRRAIEILWDTWEGQKCDLGDEPLCIADAPRHERIACEAVADEMLAPLLTRLEDAREVMEFYGDPDTWGKSLDGVRVDSPLGRDRNTAPDGHDSPGAKARRWLKGEG